MDEGLISRRYAKALLKFAQDRGTTDQIYEEVKKFEENFVSHPELQKALLNPVLSAKDKESLLAAAVGVAPGEDYLRFVRLVIHNRRIYSVDLPDVSGTLSGVETDSPGSYYYGNGAE